jgi:hypothetical protein
MRRSLKDAVAWGYLHSKPDESVEEHSEHVALEVKQPSTLPRRSFAMRQIVLCSSARSASCLPGSPSHSQQLPGFWLGGSPQLGSITS